MNESEIKKRENEIKQKSERKNTHRNLKLLDKIQTEINSPFCRRDCKVCNSDYVLDIHNLQKGGRTYEEICAYLERRNFKVSPAALSRHFQNYKKHVREQAIKKLNEEADIDISKVVNHKKAVISLIDGVLDKLQIRLKSDTLNFDIGDLEKLFKIKTQYLEGDTSGGEDLVAIFQRASEKYGAGLDQAVLFKK